MDDSTTDRDGPSFAATIRPARTPAYLERGSRRDTMLLIATLRVAGGSESTLRVRNLSAGGLMAETPVTLTEGDLVEIDLRAIGGVRARVVWAQDARAGLAFAAPIDPRAVRQPRPRTDGPAIGLIPPARSLRSSRPPLRQK